MLMTRWQARCPGATAHESLALQRERLSLSAAGRRIRIRSASRCPTATTIRSRAPRSTTAIIDEWLIAEDEGMEIMLNEHHQTATCVDPAAPLVLAALARLTKKARLLILGNPVANRRQPVRVAEEMAMVDILSKGRLECGFVRGVPYEVLPANSNPVRMNERQWEAMDLIVKAWTTPRRAGDPRGPLLPPPQHQHLAAPVSAAASADLGIDHHAGRRRARRIARLCAGDLPHRLRRDAGDLRCLSQGLARGRARRATCRSAGWPMRRCVYTGESEAEARAGAEKLLWYMTANKVPLHYLLSARLRADCRPRASPARRGDRPACREPGECDGRQGDRGRHHVRRHARSGLSRRSSDCTTMSAASATC